MTQMSGEDRMRRRAGLPPLANGIGAAKLKWLDEVLTDAIASPRPTAWERSFIADVLARRKTYGERLQLSEGQMATLRQIEGKIYAAG